MPPFLIGDQVIVSVKGEKPWIGYVYRSRKRGRRTTYDVCSPNLFVNGTCDYEKAMRMDEPHHIATVEAKELAHAK